jgi:hypothetical protein
MQAIRPGKKADAEIALAIGQRLKIEPTHATFGLDEDVAQGIALIILYLTAEVAEAVDELEIGPAVRMTKDVVDAVGIRAVAGPTIKRLAGQGGAHQGENKGKQGKSAGKPASERSHHGLSKPHKATEF